MSFVSQLELLMRRFGLNHFGVTPLAKPLSMSLYREWLESGHQASMKYLSDHADLKENPQEFAPRARTAIVVARSYFPHPYAVDERSTPRLRTALYARGEDYHFHFRDELETVARELRARYPEHEFLCFTDSAPILERDLAYRAGLGWFGKNTCLIHPREGSLFFLGQILTSLPVDAEPASPVPDFCGKCDRCLRACPTGALEEPRVLNANKCISFWTIEAREDAPPELRVRLGDWFFGCDICQTVCPWNEKVFGRAKVAALNEPAAVTDETIADLRWILTSSNKELARIFARSPLSRARPIGLKRNALVVIANRGLSQLRPEVSELVDHPRLGDLARWTLARLGGNL